MSNYKDESRRHWFPANGRAISHDDLRVGCLQRIADATELMAENNADLIRQRDEAIRSRDYWRNEADDIRRKRNALRGVITKLKAKLAATEEPRHD